MHLAVGYWLLKCLSLQFCCAPVKGFGPLCDLHQVIVGIWSGRKAINVNACQSGKPVVEVC